MGDVSACFNFEHPVWIPQGDAAREVWREMDAAKTMRRGGYGDEHAACYMR